MKKLLLFSLIACSLCCAMEKEPEKPTPSTITAYFLPDDKPQFIKALTTSLYKAKDSVLIAVYWLTDTDTINRIIDLKIQGIDIQVIVDQSTPNIQELVSAFLEYDLIPLVMPSQREDVKGIMHNKFAVIGDKVFTGSANYTSSVLNPKSAYFNNENVLELPIPELAATYKAAFFKIEDEIIELYIGLVADGVRFPHWLWRLIKELYEKNSRFEELLQENFHEYKRHEKSNIVQFFPDFRPRQPKRKGPRVRAASPFQRKILRKHGISTEGMSYDEAYNRIGQIFKGGL